MTDSMRAFALADFDQVPCLTEMPVPEPGPSEVRVRVRTSSVNPVDIASGAGVFKNMYEYRFPAILGRDVAGTIDAVGPLVTRFRIGDEVLGMVKRSYIGDGTFAEYVVVPEDRFIIHRPLEIPIAEAGALGLAGVTALQCLDALACKEGDTVFVNGATGGVGAFVIQAAVNQGLVVVASARPGAEEEHVRALGATETVDWSLGDAPAAVRAMRPRGVDGVVDLVSRDPEAFRVVAMAAASTGTAVTTLGAARPKSDGGAAMLNVHSEGDPALLHRLVDLVSSGALRVPLVDQISFDRIADALELLAAAPAGKIGLLVSS